MNTFGQGFKFGLLSGVLNNTFGGFGLYGLNSYMNNPFYNYSFSPMFFMPTFPFGSFMPYNNISNFSNPFNPLGNLDIGLNYSTSNFGHNSVFSQYINTQQAPINMDYFVSSNNIPILPSNIYNTYIPASELKVGKALDSEKPLGATPPKKEEKEVDIPPNKKPSNIDYDVENLKSKWKQKKPNLNLSDEFYNKIVKISKNINCDPNDLMGIINLESAGTFDPTIQNKQGKEYYGLIQFGKATADTLKTTLEELKSMSAEEQLDYVEKYFKFWIKDRKLKGHIDTATLYALVLLPGSIKKGEGLGYLVTGTLKDKKTGNVIEENLAWAYKDNSCLDINKDGCITKDELEQDIIRYRA